MKLEALPPSYLALIAAAKKGDVPAAKVAIDRLKQYKKEKVYRVCRDYHWAEKRRGLAPDFRTPFDLALEKGDQAMVEYLGKSGGCRSWSSQQSVFYRAAVLGHLHLFSVLLDIFHNHGFINSRGQPFRLKVWEAHDGLRLDKLLKQKGVKADAPIMRGLDFYGRVGSNNFVSLRLGLTSLGSESYSFIGLQTGSFRFTNFVLGLPEFWVVPGDSQNYFIGLSIVSLGAKFPLSADGAHEVMISLHAGGGEGKIDGLGITGIIPVDVTYRYTASPRLGFSLGIRSPIYSVHRRAEEVCEKMEEDDNHGPCSDEKGFLSNWMTVFGTLHWL